MTTSRNPPYTLKLLKRPLAGKGAGSYKIAKTAADGEKAKKKVPKIAADGEKPKKKVSKKAPAKSADAG